MNVYKISEEHVIRVWENGQQNTCNLSYNIVAKQVE